MATEIEGIGIPEMDEDFVRKDTCERCLDGIKIQLGNIDEKLGDFIGSHDKSENRRSIRLIAIVTVAIGLVSNLDKIGQVVMKLAAK